MFEVGQLVRIREQTWQVLEDHAAYAGGVRYFMPPAFRRVSDYLESLEPFFPVRTPDFLYLVNRNALAAISPALRNVEPAVLRPQILWNVDRLWIAPGK